MKNERQKMILQIIEQHPVETQEELLRLLREKGFHVTQATVSRDIRELYLVKSIGDNGCFRYVSSSQSEQPYNLNVRFETIFKESVLHVEAAGNIVLVKCFTGMANAACQVFDAMVWENVVGTLSGDDTFFILLRSELAAEALSSKLQNMMGTYHLETDYPGR